MQKKTNVIFHDGALSLQTVYENSMSANITQHLFFRLERISHVLSNHFIVYIIIPRYVQQIGAINTKNYLNSGYIKLVPSKNMYCKKKSSSAKAKICWPAITSRSLKHVNPCNIIWSIVKAKEIFLLFSSVSCIRTPNSLLHKSHLTNSLRINAMSFYLPTLLIFYWFCIWFLNVYFSELL